MPNPLLGVYGFASTVTNCDGKSFLVGRGFTQCCGLAKMGGLRIDG